MHQRTAQGYLAIVLHAHLPFVRHPEYEDALEENWLYEAITESYLPLLLMLDNLLGQGIDFRLTLSISPTLASMLRDPLLLSRYRHRIERLIELAAKEMQRTRSQPAFHRLARMYHTNFVQLRTAFLDIYQQDLLGACKRLQDLGKLEIVASAATHGYLPLLAINPSAVRAQIKLGIDFYRQLFERQPAGFWLPECGYHKGVDEFLRQQAVRYTVLETHGLTRARPRPRYGVYAPLTCPSGLHVFGRDPESSRQVWSAIEGYPGDPDYREFYRDIAHDLDFEIIKPYIHRDGIRVDTGLKYFRVTGAGRPKEIYDPRCAERKAELHAADFLSKKIQQVKCLTPLMECKPLIVAPYDAELFGHWWFEGPRWLNHLLRKIALQQETLQPVTLSEYLEEYPQHRIATPASSSWGHGGFHATWLNERNDWIYPHLHQGAAVMEKLARQHPGATGKIRRALNQAARELLCAQASDWAFMINQGDTAPYATQRTRQHLHRLLKLKEQIAGRGIDDTWLATLEKQNNIFPHIDYRLFAQKPRRNADCG